MKRSTVYLLLAVLVMAGLAGAAVRDARAARADLAYQTERWAECETELEGLRD